ncbi:MAG: hypothetical protein PVF68_09660 [Acidobacteriota bacterium]|jgi:hypothetical protein
MHATGHVLPLALVLDPRRARILIPVVLGALSSVPVSARLVRRILDHVMKQTVAALTIGMGLPTLPKTL